MNSKNNIRKRRSLSHAMAGLLLAAVLCTMGGWGAILGTAAAEGQEPLTDFTDPLGETTPIPQGEVVAGLLGGISPAEINYLNVHGEYVLYTAAIPTDKMYAHVHQGGVTVVADEYTYTTADGTVVTWVPFFAENLTTPSELVELVYDGTQNLYVASLAGGRSDRIKVYYAASLTLSEDMALTLINEAPEKAQLLMEAMAAYEQAMALWLPRKEAYDAYLLAYGEWQAATKAYDDYLTEKAVYDAWWKDHDLKKAAMDAYLTQKAAYAAWVQYGLDLVAYEEYMALVNASPELKAEYEGKMTVVFSHLSIMERMFVKSDISGRSFEGVLNSGTADYVINNKDFLLNISGVNKDDVNLAVSSTRALRKLVDGYKALDDREAQYEYYIANKDAMTATLMDLYHSMVSLGQVEYVYKEIEDRGGLDAFRQFLGNMYVQGCLMDDHTTLDPSLVLFGVPLKELVEAALTPEDHNQTAPLDAYPHPPTTSDDVPEVPYPGDPPPAAEDPGEAPAPVPDTSEAPGLPEEILPAGDAPAEVSPPEEAPAAPAMTEEEHALYEAALAGELSKRTVADLVYGGTFSVMISGEVVTLSGRTVEIKVMNYRGVLQSTQVLAFGSSLNEQLTPPRASAANGAPLTFVGWSYELTPLPDSVDDLFDTLDTGYAVANMTLYPVYRLYHTPGDEPTCTEAQTCIYCGEVLHAALGHDIEKNVTPPTCTEEGYTTHICTRCGDSHTDSATEPLGHTSKQEATCTEDEICITCGVIIKPRLEHNYTAVITPPTCTEEGYTTHTCEACGDTYKGDKTAPSEHLWGAWEIITDATETQDGIKQRVCATCQRVDEMSIPSIDHVHDYVPEVIPPTCTEDGYTLHTCRCGDSYQDTPVESAGHDYDSVISLPTCMEDGYTTYTCTVCEDTYTGDIVLAEGHTPGDAATCTEAQTCTVCGEVLDDAKGHNYMHSTHKPTCTEGGYTLHTCISCGDNYRDQESPPANHRYGEWIVDRQPAPEVEGHRYAECQACGYRMEETLPALPPVETGTQPDTETETVPEPETDTESDTNEQDTNTEPTTDADTEPVTDAETDTEPDEETDRGTATDSESETPSEPEDTTQAPIGTLPEVKWYAKLLGAVGLPGLVTIAGVVLGGGTAGVAILTMRAVRKKRSKK